MSDVAMPRKALRTEREFLRAAWLRGAVIMLLATLVAVILTSLSVSDLPDYIQQRTILIAIVLPLLIAPPAIAYTIGREVENHRLMLQINRLAHTDGMTGLANRRAFMGQAEEALIGHDYEAEGLAVFIVDLDHFKRVNDQYGHDAGDIVLKCVSDRMARALPRAALLARLGGEEFAVMVKHKSMADLHDIADSLREAVGATPCNVGAYAITVTISIGIGLSDARDTISDVLSRADVALYDAKHDGRNRIAIAA